MVKNYILDTGILLQYPNSIFGFDDNHVIIAGASIAELDKKCEEFGEAGYNAREVLKSLDELSGKGSLTMGVRLPNGGMVRIVYEENLNFTHPMLADSRDPETHVLRTALYLKPYGEFRFVCNKAAIKIRASEFLGAENVESYKNAMVTGKSFTGHKDLDISSDIINLIYGDKRIKAGDIPVNGMDLHENEFVTMKSGNQSALTVYRRGEFELIPQITTFGNTKPKNAMQTYAIWALTQPASDLPLVLLNGPAGTAKTYLSLAAGLSQTYSGSEYYKMLISRPNTLTEDLGLGYLPGDVDEKLAPLLAPYYDNLEALFVNHSGKEEKAQIRLAVEDLFETGTIEVCALSYIRGRTLQNSYMICDEAQNASKLLIRDVITRCGEGSKIVVAGDPSQCDNPKMDAYSNGLVYAIDKFKDSKNAAVITFEAKNSVRSELAKEAVELL